MNLNSKLFSMYMQRPKTIGEAISLYKAGQKTAIHTDFKNIFEKHC